MSNINNTVDPCNDFYEFACGNWLENNKMPPNSYTYSGNGSIVTQLTGHDRLNDLFEPYKVVTKIGERNSRILFEALTRPEPRIRASDDFTGRQKAKDFYKSCQNIRILNEKGNSLWTIEPFDSYFLGSTPLLLDIASVGGWDALDNWDNRTWNINEMLYKGNVMKLEVKVFLVIQFDSYCMCHKLLGQHV